MTLFSVLECFSYVFSPIKGSITIFPEPLHNTKVIVYSFFVVLIVFFGFYWRVLFKPVRDG